MIESIVKPEDIEQLKKMLPAIPYRVIERVEQAKDVSMWRQRADQGLKRVEEVFGPAVEAAYQAHKKIVALKKRAAAPFEEVKRLTMQMHADWQRREEERIAAEQRRLDEEARLKAQEAARVEAEHQKAILAEAKAKNDAAAAKAAREAVANAKQMQKDIASGLMPVTSGVVVQAQEVAGLSGFTKWSADLNVDMRVLVQAAAAQPVLLMYLLPNQKALDSAMSSTKGQAVIPGVRPMKKFVSTQRGA